MIDYNIKTSKNIDLGNCTLTLMVTMGCYSECAHCCLASGRDKLQFRLSREEMKLYIKQAHEVGIHHVAFTGGEPTAYLEDLYEPMALARDLGMYIDLRTNGCWAINLDTAHRIVRSLCDVGLQRLGLSFDHYHEEQVSLTCIQNAIKTAQANKITIYLDWIGGKDRYKIAHYLGIEETLIRMVGMPLKVGQAKQLSDQHFDAIPIEEIEHRSEFSYSCGNNGCAPLLTIFPNDYVSFHPCCWVNPLLIVRKVEGEDWLAKLVRDTANNPAVIFLCDYGLNGLIKVARDECPSLLKTHYSHQCELCYNLLPQLFPSEIKLPDYLTGQIKLKELALA